MLFANATVVDGTGEPRYRADVRVRGDRIVEIGALEPGDESVIDCTDLVLSPGFVDMHAHSDLAVLADRDHLAKVSQGVTTEVTGQDGLGYAPVNDATLGQIRRQIAGWNGDPGGVAWRSVSEYLERLDAGVAVNQAVLVPHGNLRLLVIGQEDRPATAAELASMCALLREGLEAGAVGLSTGLTYTPGMFADTAELEALCAVVAEYGGYHSTHTRGYGGGALAAFAEVIGIAERSGCPVHLTHATMNFPANRGRAAELLAPVDAALARGVDVSLDSYPYLPGSTTLAALLPSWASAGGPDALLARLRNPGEVERIRVALEETGSDGAHGELVDWAAIQVSASTEGAAVGRSIADIAGGGSAVQAVVELLLGDALSTGILMHVGDEANLRAIMRHPLHSGGSDGILVGDRPHPRAWGTFPRYLGHYCRELGLLSLEECVRHLAENPAKRLGWTDRGLVRAGYAADLVVFDPRTVADRATFEQPRLLATGIHHVVVNGRSVLENGSRTATAPGRALRRT